MNRVLKFRCFYKNEMCRVKALRFSDTSFSVSLTTSDMTDIECESDQIISLMQFTGLVDKNGREIYESDRIRLYRKGSFVTAVIIFENGIFCLEYDDGYKNNYPLNPGNYEVVGNIFEP